MRKLLAALSAVALLFALAGSVSSATFVVNGSSCAQYMVTNSVCLKENSDGSGDEILLLQSASTFVDNLLQAPDMLPNHTCWSSIPHNSFNDCISYVRFNLASGYKACGFSDAYYNHLVWRNSGPANSSRSFADTEAQDSISSIVLVPNSNGLC